MTLWLAAALALASSPGNAATAPHSGPSAPASVAAYFERLQAVFRDSSDAADIDRLLALFTEDGRYVHLKYEADFDLAAWRAAFLRNLERGAFTASPRSNTPTGHGATAATAGPRATSACWRCSTSKASGSARLRNCGEPGARGTRRSRWQCPDPGTGPSAGESVECTVTAIRP